MFSDPIVRLVLAWQTKLDALDDWAINFQTSSRFTWPGVAAKDK